MDPRFAQDNPWIARIHGLRIRQNPRTSRKCEARSGSPQLHANFLSLMALASTRVGRSSRRGFGGPNTDPQEIEERLVESSKRLHIFIVGKAGAGKTLLTVNLLGPSVQRLKTAPRPGWRAVSSEDVYEISVGDVSVLIHDMPGYVVWSGVHFALNKILDKIGQIISNDAHYVLLVCIDMHQRVDESIVETFALIHRRFGKEIWRYAVIALTKADLYPKKEWLEQKRWWERERPILEKKFAVEFDDVKRYWRSFFTSTGAYAGSEYRIGLTEKEFDDLAIPFIPTSILTSKDAMKRMVIVGHESWFDNLLVECAVRRERCIALVKLRSRRFLKAAIGDVLLEVRLHEFIKYYLNLVIGHCQVKLGLS